jgi:YVTN family beta-propeller protein
MNLRISVLIAAVAFAGIFGSAQSLAQNAYITNGDSNSVSVIDTATNTVTATIAAGFSQPLGVAVTSDGSKVYVGNASSPFSVSVIDTATNSVIAALPVPLSLPPIGVAVTPDGSKVYVTYDEVSSVSVIDTATNTTATIQVGSNPFGVAVTPNGRDVYVANYGSNTVSVIDTASNVNGIRSAD